MTWNLWECARFVPWKGTVLEELVVPQRIMFPHVYWTLRFITFFRVPNPAYVLSRMNPFHTQPNFLMISYSVYAHVFQLVLFLKSFRQKSYMHVYFNLCVLHALPISSIFDHVNKCRGVQIIKLQFVHFFRHFIISSLMGLDISPSTSVGAIPLLYYTKVHPHPYPQAWLWFSVLMYFFKY